MKTIFTLIVLLGVGFYMFYPYISKEKICYDKSQLAYNDIGYSSASRGLDKTDICERRADVLLDLEDCIKVSTGSGYVPKYGNTIIQKIVSWLRPVAKDIFELKNEHNTECSEYPNFLVE